MAPLPLSSCLEADLMCRQPVADEASHMRASMAERNDRAQSVAEELHADVVSGVAWVDGAIARSNQLQGKDDVLEELFGAAESVMNPLQQFELFQRQLSDADWGFRDKLGLPPGPVEVTLAPRADAAGSDIWEQLQVTSDGGGVWPGLPEEHEDEFHHRASPQHGAASTLPSSLVLVCREGGRGAAEAAVTAAVVHGSRQLESDAADLLTGIKAKVAWSSAKKVSGSSVTADVLYAPKGCSRMAVPTPDGAGTAGVGGAARSYTSAAEGSGEAGGGRGEKPQLAQALCGLLLEHADRSHSHHCALEACMQQISGSQHGSSRRAPSSPRRRLTDLSQPVGSQAASTAGQSREGMHAPDARARARTTPEHDVALCKQGVGVGAMISTEGIARALNKAINTSDSGRAKAAAGAAAGAAAVASAVGASVAFAVGRDDTSLAAAASDPAASLLRKFRRRTSAAKSDSMHTAIIAPYPAPSPLSSAAAPHTMDAVVSQSAISAAAVAMADSAGRAEAASPAAAAYAPTARTPACIDVPSVATTVAVRGCKVAADGSDGGGAAADDDDDASSAFVTTSNPDGDWTPSASASQPPDAVSTDFAQPLHWPLAQLSHQPERLVRSTPMLLDPRSISSLARSEQTQQNVTPGGMLLLGGMEQRQRRPGAAAAAMLSPLLRVPPRTIIAGVAGSCEEVEASNAWSGHIQGAVAGQQLAAAAAAAAVMDAEAFGAGDVRAGHGCPSAGAPLCNGSLEPEVNEADAAKHQGVVASASLTAGSSDGPRFGTQLLGLLGHLVDGEQGRAPSRPLDESPGQAGIGESKKRRKETKSGSKLQNQAGKMRKKNPACRGASVAGATTSREAGERGGGRGGAKEWGKGEGTRGSGEVVQVGEGGGSGREAVALLLKSPFSDVADSSGSLGLADLWCLSPTTQASPADARPLLFSFRFSVAAAAKFSSCLLPPQPAWPDSDLAVQLSRGTASSRSSAGDISATWQWQALLRQVSAAIDGIAAAGAEGQSAGRCGRHGHMHGCTDRCCGGHAHHRQEQGRLTAGDVHGIASHGLASAQGKQLPRLPLHIANPWQLAFLPEAPRRMSCAEMKSLICDYAFALAFNDVARVRALELSLATSSSLAGDAVQRLGAMFFALLKRQKGLHVPGFRLPVEYTHLVLPSMTAYFNTIPWLKFAYSVAYSAFAGTLMSRRRVHLVTFGSTLIGMWAPLLCALAARPMGAPDSIRLTTFRPALSKNPEFTVRAQAAAAHVGEKVLRDSAAQTGVKMFEHRQVDLTEDALRDMEGAIGRNKRTGQPWMEHEEGEALVVLIPFAVNFLPHSPRSEDSPLSLLLQWLGKLKPESIAVVDFDWDLVSTFFLSRLHSSLDYIGSVMDLHDEVGGKEKRPHMVVVEDMMLGQLVVQALLPSEEIRIVPRTCAMWARDFLRCGWKPAACARKVLGSLRDSLEEEPFHPAVSIVAHKESENSLQLCWKGQPLAFTSLWKTT